MTFDLLASIVRDIVRALVFVAQAMLLGPMLLLWDDGARQ